MAKGREAKQKFSEKSGKFRLWLGLLLPPAAWAVQLQTVYLTSEYACLTGNFLPNHVVSIIALILSIVALFVSWQNFLAVGAEWKSEAGGAVSRSRFMVNLGLLTGGLFALVIFAQWLPTLLGVPCEK